MINSLPLLGGQGEKNQNDGTNIHNKTTPYDPLPRGDLLCEGIILSCKLQKPSEDAEQAKSKFFMV